MIGSSPLPVPGWLVLLLLLSLSSSAAAARITQFSVLTGSDGTETVASVAAQPRNFHPLDRPSLSAGYTRDVHWLRLIVAREPGDPAELWLEIQPPYLDDIRLYEPQPGGGFSERRAGDRLPFAAREIPYRGFLFRIHPPPQGSYSLYLRMHTTSTSLLFARVWRPDDFHPAALEEALAMGFYYGMVALVLISNLIYWFWVRHRLYLAYAFYVAATAVLMSSIGGLTFQYLLPGHPRLADGAVGAGMFLATFASGLFFPMILRLGKRWSLLLLMFRLQVWLPPFAAITLFTGHYTEAGHALVLFNLAVTVLSVARAVRLFRDGVPGGTFLLFSLLVFAFGLLSNFLTVLGLLPGTLFAVHGVQIGGLGHMLLMHMAIAARVRAIDRERQQALAQAAAAEATAGEERAARRRQARFLSMLDHELKGPLAVIGGAVQSLRRLAGAGEPEVTRRHQRIHASVGRIDALIGQCLAYDRLDQEGVEVRRAPVDLRRLVAATVSECGEAGRRIECVFDGAARLSGDGGLLQVALHNLLENALKYAPAPAPIRVRVAQEGDRMVIEVADGGPGVEAASAERLFEPFVRGDSDLPGAGLGLYLVRRIARLHGGEATLAAVEEGGACFRLWLPLAEGCR
ncbi:sensor histidine kinase [Endothiovibrio diazotrophicus]